jgi:hypothetical protein
MSSVLRAPILRVYYTKKWYSGNLKIPAMLAAGGENL